MQDYSKLRWDLFLKYPQEAEYARCFMYTIILKEPKKYYLRQKIHTKQSMCCHILALTSCRYFPPTTRVFSVSTRARERPVIFTGDIVFKLFHIHSFAQLGTQYIELARLIFHTGMEYHVQAKKSSATPKGITFLSF